MASGLAEQNGGGNGHFDKTVDEGVVELARAYNAWLAAQRRLAEAQGRIGDLLTDGASMEQVLGVLARCNTPLEALETVKVGSTEETGE